MGLYYPWRKQKFPQITEVGIAAKASSLPQQQYLAGSQLPLGGGVSPTRLQIPKCNAPPDPMKGRDQGHVSACVRRPVINPTPFLRLAPWSPFCAEGYGTSQPGRLYCRAFQASPNRRPYLGGKPRLYPHGGGNCHEAVVERERKKL